MLPILKELTASEKYSHGDNHPLSRTWEHSHEEGPMGTHRTGGAIRSSFRRMYHLAWAFKDERDCAVLARHLRESGVW